MYAQSTLLRAVLFAISAPLAMVVLPGLVSSPEAKPRSQNIEQMLEQISARSSTPPALYGTPMGTAEAGDTVYFGGTTWDPVEMRWEALRDSVWTFESGVGSVINADSTLKQVGLHALMEGWYGVDLTAPERGEFFRRSMTCVIDGSWSMWAGVTESEAAAMEWKEGQGYGANWVQAVGKTFDYPGSGSVTLEFDYQVETEQGFDFLYVYVDTIGSLDRQDYIELIYYDGTGSGTESVVLIPGVHLPVGGSFRVVFMATSDSAYDDDDGFWGTVCGHSAVDNVVLSGAISDTSDFETGEDDWSFLRIDTVAGGDWSDIQVISELTVDPEICTSAFGDSALIFSDLTIPGGGHGTFQDNMAVSPWIDLTDPDVFGKPGKVLEFTGYMDLPSTSFILYPVRIRWQPEDLPSPTGTSEIDGFHYITGASQKPECFSRENWGQIDLTGEVPPDAEQIQVGFGVWNICRFFAWCSMISNESPWFDDVRVGVFDGPSAQVLQAWDIDLPRDTFPEHDPQLDFINMTGRFDSSAPVRPGALGDTLVVKTGEYSRSRVDVLFRVFGGPGIDDHRLSSWLAGFTDEGDGWVSARMDTAESDGAPVNGSWMTAFHEEDLNFSGTDEDLDSEDRYPGGQLGRLANDIFPDDLFTAGSRVELFYRWNLIDIPGITSLLPDTTGGNFLELEVLPSSLELVGGIPVNNAVLYVNQVRGPDIRSAMEGALTNLLPGGSANREGTRWDRLDLPAADLMIPADHFFLYGPIEHDVVFLDRYDTIIWGFSTDQDAVLQDNVPDAIRLRAWLDCTGGGEGGGNGCGRALYMTGETSTVASSSFYRALGVEEFCQRVSVCSPLGRISESCMEVFGNNASSHFGQGSGWNVETDGRVNGAWVLADLLTPRVSQGDAVHEVNLSYRTQLGDSLAAAAMSTTQLVRTEGDVTGYWKSVYEGVPISLFGDGPDCEGSPNAVAARLGEVLAWFEAPGPTPVTLLSFHAVRGADGVTLNWKVAGDPSGHAGFHVYRQVPGGERKRITPSLLPSQGDYTLIDAEAPPGRLDYWLAELDRSGSSSWHGPFAVEGSGTPLRFQVHQSYPNPFANSASIRFELPEATEVQIQVFSLDGRLVADLSTGLTPSGVHQVTWNGRDTSGRQSAAGIYLYRLVTLAETVTRKMVKMDGAAGLR